jgi:iron complex outermembrane receptor protein
MQVGARRKKRDSPRACAYPASFSLRGIVMSAIKSNRLKNSSAGTVLLAASLLFAAPAYAQQVAQANDLRTGDIDTVVVTGTAFNPDSAPAKSSLETMEPQTIINKSYVDDSVANTADFTTILAIAPSMTGQDINGPGLSDGNVKNTLRGLPDGDFVMSYDGIPFGDTNGPSHHSESYFPGVTIGTIDVDRGPGNAGTLGAATFGGSVNMFSERLTEDSRFSAAATGGSWSTTSFNANYQTGSFDVAVISSRVLVNLNDTNSDGYLTFQNTSRENYLVKFQSDIAPGWTLTAFANYNGLFQHVNDNNGETPAQINTYGERYALQVTNPNEGTYKLYNPEGKKTDMDYLRLQGDMGGITLDDTAYTYAYVNKTISSSNVEQSQTDVNNGVTEGNGTVVNGVKHAGDVPGYTKQNAYRVWGNILRLSDDFDWSGITGELRVGLWSEASATQRHRFDFDLTQCIANSCNPWHNQTYADSSLSASTLGAAKAKSAAYEGGYAEYDEHSGWTQYQPFAELELHPFDGLTVTPGIKYVTETLSVAAPLEQKTVPVVPFSGSFTSTRTLPFLMANYKIEPNWSVYAQYANGIYVPDISSFEQSTPAITFPKPETTTNYQFGSVYYADNFTVDGDLYYIGVNNNISEAACPAPDQSETCASNTGTAEYKGVEGEGTYTFDGGFSIFASGSLNYTRTSGAGATFAGVLKNAPLWTEATGFVYKNGDFSLSLIDKLVGQQYVGKQTLSAALSSFYKLPAYNNMDFKGSYNLGKVQLGLGIYNLLDERNLIGFTVNDKSAIGSSVTDLADRGTSLDQYYFAPSRSFQISLKAVF